MTIDRSEVSNRKVDILFVVDNSASTSDVQVEMRAALASFVTPLWDADIDFQLGVISTDSYMSYQWFSQGWNTEECSNGTGGIVPSLRNPSNNTTVLGCPGATVLDDRRIKPYQGYKTSSKDQGHLLHKTPSIFLKRADYVNKESVRNDFESNITIGTGGWPIESSILSILAALNDSELNGFGYNRSFIRNDAALHVIAAPVAEASSSAFGRGDEFGPRTAASGWPFDNVSIDAPSARIARLKARLNTLKGGLTRVRFDVIGNQADLPNYASAVSSIGSGSFIQYTKGYGMSGQLESLATSLIENVSSLTRKLQLNAPIYRIVSATIGGRALRESEYTVNIQSGIFTLNEDVAASNDKKVLKVEYQTP